MVLAAGEETRLRPLTPEIPEALLPAGGVPLICYTLAWLRRYGISQVLINPHHLGEKVRESLGDGSRFGVEISYSQEDSILGAVDGVKRMEQFFDGTFVVIYGDVLTDFDLPAMISFHRAKKALTTLAPLQATNLQEVGVVKLDKKDLVVSFMEKPQSPISNPQPSLTLANSGIYVLQTESLDYIPSQGFADFACDIFPKLIGLGLPVYGYRLQPADYLIDIGSPEKYRKANENVLDHSKFKLQSAILNTEPRTLNIEH